MVHVLFIIYSFMNNLDQETLFSTFYIYTLHVMNVHNNALEKFSEIKRAVYDLF